MQEKEKWALSKCMAICSKAEKCISDIEKKLVGWELSTDAVDWVIKELVAQKFIDEERYAFHYVRDKFRFNQWGRTKITFMLKGKSISLPLIKMALNEIDDDEYFQTLFKLIKSKERKISYKSEYDKKSKLIRFAQGRGFEYEVIATVLDAISNVDA